MATESSAMGGAAIEIAISDPRSREAAELIRALSEELSARYDHADDGSGHFKPEDALIPRSAFLVGWVDRRPVACGAFRPLDGDIAEVKRMYVIPDCRGRGYSKAILAELERLAHQCGYSAVRLETGDRQPEAIRLYERSGYHRIPNFGGHLGSERSVCFEKKLPRRN